MEYKYKIGQKVRLKPSSIYFKQSGGTEGVITKYLNLTAEYTEYKYFIEWGNGRCYDYRDSDIEAANVDNWQEKLEG